MVAADTAELASDFEAISRRTIAVVPIPHSGNTGQERIARRLEQPITLVYAGIGTRTKGFDLLPEIVEGLSDLIEGGQIAFRIQANILDQSPEVRRAVTRLRTLKIEMIDGPLEPRAYYDLLEDADILIQPHDPAYYQKQSSGVFTEGRSAGLIGIVPARTTMAGEITRSGGGIAVDDWTADAYVRAVRSCVANFHRLASEAKAAARAWQKLNSAEGLRLSLNSLLPPTHQL